MADERRNERLNAPEIRKRDPHSGSRDPLSARTFRLCAACLMDRWLHNIARGLPNIDLVLQAGQHGHMERRSA